MTSSSALDGPPQKLYRTGKALAGFVFSILLSSQRRHAFRWLRSRQKHYLLDTPSPWLTFDAIEYLGSKVQRGWRVFDMAAGVPTLFWNSLGTTCVSVEHDPAWFSLMQARLSGEKLDYRLVLPELAGDPERRAPDPADPEGYRSGGLEWRGHTFRNYASQIDAFPDRYLDLVLVDGRARPSCLKHSVSKVKSGSLLVLDNAERAYYTEKCANLLRLFSKVEFFGALPVVPYFARTDVYIRTHHECGRS